MKKAHGIDRYELESEHKHMPLTKKGKEIEHAMEHEYGDKKGKQVFYASKNKGTIKGVEEKKHKMASKMVKVMGHEVKEGSKKHSRLVADKKHYDDLARHER